MTKNAVYIESDHDPATGDARVEDVIGLLHVTGVTQHLAASPA